MSNFVQCSVLKFSQLGVPKSVPLFLIWKHRVLKIFQNKVSPEVDVPPLRKLKKNIYNFPMCQGGLVCHDFQNFIKNHQ